MKIFNKIYKNLFLILTVLCFLLLEYMWWFIFSNNNKENLMLCFIFHIGIIFFISICRWVFLIDEKKELKQYRDKLNKDYKIWCIENHFKPENFFSNEE